MRGIESIIFLGAGLSFGVDRGRAMFERDEFDDNRRFPSWPQLIKRMQKSLLSDPVLEPFKDAVNHFFEEESALDCAELFRNYTHGPNYWDFLRNQFGSKPDDVHYLTRSHDGLTRLPIKRIFTTNYDELIETAYRAKGIRIRVSSSSRDFMDHRATQDTHHLIKLHGTIDEAHYIRGGKNPISYVVQARKDPIREAYLRSLGVNAITLTYWEQLPTFLSAIHPNTDLASLPPY